MIMLTFQVLGKYLLNKKLFWMDVRDPAVGKTAVLLALVEHKE